MAEPIAEKLKSKKGKNFGVEEECQLCRSFQVISQDPVAGTGQKSIAFWQRIMEHYNCNRPSGSGPRPWRSLETKWAVIKGEVAKFCVAYAQVETSKEGNGSNDEEKLKKAQELYRAKSPKNQSFPFLHCWEIVKDVPKLTTPKELERTPSLKRKSTESDILTASASPGEDVCSPAIDVTPSVSFKLANRPKNAKEELRAAALKDSALKAQAKATSELAVATLERNAILKDQAALALFTIPAANLLEEDAKEYLSLRRAEELHILKARLAARRPPVANATTLALAPTTPSIVHVDAPPSAAVSASSAVEWMEPDGMDQTQIRQVLCKLDGAK